MSKYKTLLVVSYIELFVWWVIIFVLGEELSVGASFFNLGESAFAIAFGVYMLWRTSKVNSTYIYKLFLILYSTGLSLYGVGNLIWFYADIVLGTNIPFPSLADVFYLAQMPLCIWGLFYFMYIFDPIVSSKYRTRVGYSVVIFCLALFINVGLLSIVIFGIENVTIEKYLTLFFPFESFSVLVLAFVLYQRRLLRIRVLKTSALVFILVGHLMFFFADMAFLFASFMASLSNANLADLLYVTALFITFYGLSDFFEHTWQQAVNHNASGIYFQDITYYKPMSLN